LEAHPPAERSAFLSVFRGSKHSRANVLASVAVAVLALFVLRRLPALPCPHLQPYLLLGFQAAAARMHAMDPRAARVSFLGEVVVAVFVASDDGLLAGAFSLGGGGRVMV